MLPGTCPEIENHDNRILEVALISGSSKDRSSVSETVALARVAAIAGSFFKRLQKVRRYDPKPSRKNMRKLFSLRVPVFVIK